MEDFKRKRKIRSKVYSRTAFIALFLFTFFLTQGAWGMLQKQSESKRNLAQVNKKLEEAEVKKEELSLSMKELQTSNGIEKEIRNKFSVARPGEEVVVIIESKDGTEDISGQKKTMGRKISEWFSEWFSDLFKN